MQNRFYKEMSWKRWIRKQLYQMIQPMAYRLHLWLTSDETSNMVVAQQSDAVQNITYIETLVELDEALQEAESAFQRSHDAGREKLDQIHFRLRDDFPSDPYSAEYASVQMDMYLALSGRDSYQAEVNEHSAFDLEQAKRKPFPYSTDSPSIVATQLIAQGYIIQLMDLSPGAHIVEFGPGWGGLTLRLAQMGYNVTAIEIEKNFVELIRYRAKALDVQVNLINEDMATFKSNKLYDVALFFESFHHCTDHLALLQNLYDMITPEGVIVFAGEPIASFPHPWGFIRPDGLTLWSIRKFGWFELGFDMSYFLRTLLLFGWIPQEYRSDASPLAHVILTRKSQGIYNLSEVTLPPDEALTWGKVTEDYRLTTAQSVLSCQRDGEIAYVEFCLSNFWQVPLNITLIVGSNEHNITLSSQETHHQVIVNVFGWQGEVSIVVREHTHSNSILKDASVAVHWIQLIQSKKN